MQKFTTAPASIPFSQLQRELKNERYIGNIDTKPWYQREYVWTGRFKRDLIISILKGYPIGVITTRQKLNNNILEIVDGQQRIKTINEFLTNELTLNGTHSRLAKEVVEKMGYKNQKNIYKFKDLPIDLKDELIRNTIATQNIITDNDSEVSEYFYMIQNQEKLKAGEIIESFPETHFDNLFIKYEKEIEKFNEYINYKNNRKEFLKILFSILAFEKNKLPLGSLDENIIKFVRNFTNSDLKKENDLDEEEVYNQFENQLKKIVKLEESIDVGIAKKRFIKLALLVLNKKPMNSMINWKKMALLNKYLSEYNSKKWRQNEEENIDKLINDEIIISENEYVYFEDLFNSFVGSKTKKNIDSLIIYWTNKL